MLNISRSQRILCRSHRLEKHGFADRVKDHKENGRPYSLLHADAGAGYDQAQIRYGRKRQNLLGVILCNGHHTCHNKCQPADTGDNDPDQVALKRRRDTDQQIHSRLDHRRTM